MMSLGTPPDVDERKARVEAARRSLAQGQEGGAGYLEFVDALVMELGGAAGWSEPGRALVALGGFGRGELALRSDIDLLFLTDGKGKLLPPVDAVLYPLWDLGFEVGHAVRTPKECAKLAGEDLSAATALMDGRLLLGDRGLWEEARHRTGIRPGGSRRMRSWVPKIIEDVDARRVRFGDVSHLLEPHIKEGRGGLRDYQSARWLLTCLGQVSGPSEAGITGWDEAAAAYAYLGRVRNVLHAVAGRKTDHLTFDFHREVAARTAPTTPLERFFEDLHRASHHIAAFWEIASSGARHAPSRGRRPPPVAKSLQEALEEHARSGASMNESLRRAILEGDKAVVSDGVRSAVGRILRSRVRLAPLLHQLHEVGALGLVAPELEAVAHQVHYDARHSFTTGIHCIETLDAFDDLWLGTLEKDETHLTRIASGVLRPWVARLAALCHDLGKIDPSRDHAQAGSAIAVAMARRLGFDAEEAEEVAGLVARHKAMPAIAFRRDLEDPATWKDARRAAGDPSTLETLIVLAAADLRATHRELSSNLWTGWKRDLLLTLCARAFGPDDAESTTERLTRIRAEVLALHGGDAGGRVGDLWDRMPTREALQIPPDLVARLLSLASDLRDRPGLWWVDERGDAVAEVLGAARWAPTLLSTVMGALSSLRMDILSFQIHSWTDGTVHLWVRAAHPEGLPDPSELAARLERSLSDGRSRARPHRSNLRNPRNEAVPVPVRVKLLDDGGPFHTALEVRCRDRRGLLRDLAACFERLQLQVTYALVTTVGPMAQDVFHLKDIFGGRLDGETKIRALIRDVDAVATGGALPQEELSSRPGSLAKERDTI